MVTTWAGEREYTAQQRAARVAARLVMRQQAGLGGMSVMEIASFVGLTDRGARQMMRRLEMVDWPFFYCDNGRWCVQVDYNG
jgi:hypothetical protein